MKARFNKQQFSKNMLKFFSNSEKISLIKEVKKNMPFAIFYRKIYFQ